MQNHCFDMLQTLPFELAVLVLDWISHTDVGPCRGVCKAWRTLTDAAVQQRQVTTIEAAVVFLMYGGPMAEHNPSVRHLVAQLSKGDSSGGSVQIAGGPSDSVLAVARDRQLMIIKCSDCATNSPVAAERLLIDTGSFSDAGAWVAATKAMLAMHSHGLQHVTAELVSQFLTPRRLQHTVPGYDSMVATLANVYDRAYLLSLLASTVCWHDGDMYTPSAVGLLYTARLLTRLNIVPQNHASGQCIYGAFVQCMRPHNVTVTQAFSLLPALCSVHAGAAVTAYRTRYNRRSYVMVVLQPVGAAPSTGLELQRTFNDHFAPTPRGHVRALIAPYSIFKVAQSVHAMEHTLRHN